MITTKQYGIKSDAEFTALLKEIVRLKDDRDALKAKQDAAIAKAKVQHDYVAKEKELAEKLAQAETYAARNRDLLFPGKAKIATRDGLQFGWRYGKPSIVLLSRRFSWGGVIKRLKSFRRGRYLKPAYEVRKDRLRLDLPDAELAQVGLRAEQTESFYVAEPKTRKATGK